MNAKTLETNRRRPFCIPHLVMYAALLAIIPGCTRSEKPMDPVVQDENIDLDHSGQYASGDWTYIHSISSAGTRSEGYYGTLSYKQIELPAPIHINDYYETPWGQLYWVGQPVVMFGSHGWMPKPLAREPIGQMLIDPAIARSDRFLLHLKVVAPGELYTPDRLEKDPNVLATLKPFGLTEAHIQYDWFSIGSDPIRLHDTKRWGMLTVCRSDRYEQLAPALEFTCTTDLSIDTSPKPVTLAELMPPPEYPAQPNQVSLSPQVETLQPIRCTLSSFVGEPLVLYLVCRIEDQGPDGPWKSPRGGRVCESKRATSDTTQ